MFENIIFEAESQEDQDFLPLVTFNDESGEDGELALPDALPILALKNTVLFPGVVIPISVGRDKSVKAVNKAYKSDKLVGVVSQKDVSIKDPSINDLYKVGTVARIAKMLRMPDGTHTAILQGKTRFRLQDMISSEPFLMGTIERLDYSAIENPLEFEALISTIRDKAKQIIELAPNIPTEAMMVLKNIKNDIFLLNFIASNLNADVNLKQGILEESDQVKKAEKVLKQMDSELQVLELKNQIESKVRDDIEQQQRDYFLNQQLKTIQEELGQNPQEMDIESMEERAEKKEWPKRAKEAFDKEIQRLKRMNPQVAEYSVTLNYLEFMLDLPWQEYSEDEIDLKYVKEILDRDHFGLEKVKDRIIEHLAVLKLKGDMKAPIVCLVGPPGVGKTSLGRSIADALKRKFMRMSLGGLHDESEIRGHRRTYIGAMPGRILQGIKKSGTSNPVFILDEIDKLGRDFRGDPSSALLEVLDPEQNNSFHDNYLDLEYDLSRVLFIATANTLSTIQPALRDRMEIIEISGYSTEDKVEIAKKHLIPKQLKEHGLKKSHVSIGKPVLRYIIQNYTRESGVRSLDRRIAGLMRATARKVATEEEYDKKLSKEVVRDILGPTKFQSDLYKKVDVPGVAVGLAWTSVGGDILFVESSLSKGKGKLTLTGNLGDVMKESATTALSFVKAHSEDLDIDSKDFENCDVHTHVPAGAIPKDGPSAGVTMLTALASAFTGRKVKPYLAMTGEITLRGKVLPVGGIKEKVLAAKRAGLKEILLSEDNEKHVAEIKEQYIQGLKFKYVDTMKEVLDYALMKK